MDSDFEVQARIEALKNDPILQEIKSKAVVIPLAAMATSLLTMSLGRRLLARPNVSLKRPVLFQVGMGILGAMTGLQLSALWLQSKYVKLDPEGRCLKELSAIASLKKKNKTSEN